SLPRRARGLDRTLSPCLVDSDLCHRLYFDDQARRLSAPCLSGGRADRGARARAARRRRDAQGSFRRAEVSPPAEPCPASRARRSRVDPSKSFRMEARRGVCGMLDFVGKVEAAVPGSSRFYATPELLNPTLQ